MSKLSWKKMTDKESGFSYYILDINGPFLCPWIADGVLGFSGVWQPRKEYRRETDVVKFVYNFGRYGEVIFDSLEEAKQYAELKLFETFKPLIKRLEK